MSNDNEKKHELYKELSSIFKEAGIPPEDDGNKAEQPGRESIPENMFENQDNQPPYTPDRKQNFTVHKSAKPTSLGNNNSSREPNRPVSQERKDDVLPKPSSDEPQKYQSTLLQKLNQQAPVEYNHNSKGLTEKTVEKHKDNLNQRPSSNQINKPQSRSVQTFNRQQGSLRKDVSQSKTMADESEKTSKLRENPAPGQWQQLKEKLFKPKPGVSSARQKATVILIPILIVVFVFVLRQVFWSAPEKTKGADKGSSVVKVSDSDNEIDWKIPEPLPSGLRDPMYPVTKNPEKQTPETIQEKTEITITVNGVLYSRDNPAALIGNKIVHTGDIISGAEIITIDRDSVTFEIDGRRWKENVRQ